MRTNGGNPTLKFGFGLSGIFFPLSLLFDYSFLVCDLLVDRMGETPHSLFPLFLRRSNGGNPALPFCVRILVVDLNGGNPAFCLCFLGTEFLTPTSCCPPAYLQVAIVRYTFVFFTLRHCSEIGRAHV